MVLDLSGRGEAGRLQVDDAARVISPRDKGVEQELPKVRFTEMAQTGNSARRVYFFKLSHSNCDEQRNDAGDGGGLEQERSAVSMLCWQCLNGTLLFSLVSGATSSLTLNIYHSVIFQINRRRFRK